MSDAQEPNQLPSIPHDILVDILSRLPTKSLIKFRCVCKPWNILTRNQKFTEFHLRQATPNPTQTRVLLSVKPFWSIEYDELDDFGKDGRDVIIKNDTHSGLTCLGSNNDFELIGHCNGLICIMLKKFNGRSGNRSNPVGRSFCLWNPTTKECREIASKDVANSMDSGSSMFGCENEARDQVRLFFQVFGFGYDSIIDDYKIVTLAYYTHRHDPLVVQRTEIFTIGTRTWRKKEAHVKYDSVHLKYGHRTSDCSFLNGSFHWIITTDYWTENSVILSFNLEQETVHEMAMPNQDLPTRGNKVTLRVMFEKLVLLAKSDIWVMDEYGDETSWTKTEVTLPVMKRRFVGMTGYVSLIEDEPLPICFSKNGGVFVLVRDFHYMMYDPKMKGYRNSGGEKLKNRPHGCMYMQSLISPNRVPNAPLS